MGRTLHARIVDTDLSMCLKVVIQDHAACADNGHLPNFSGLQPATLDCGESVLFKDKEMFVTS